MNREERKVLLKRADTCAIGGNAAGSAIPVNESIAK